MESEKPGINDLFLQSGNRDTDIVNKGMDTKGERKGGGMN